MMNTKLMHLSLSAVVLASVPATAADISFKGMQDGVLTVEGKRDENRRTSDSREVSSGAIYGFAYSGREVGSGRIVAGSSTVNVDRHGPDAGWYDYRHAYQTPGVAGSLMKDSFHLGHWRGMGTFSFKDCRVVPLKAVYAETDLLTLGHGESVEGNRYKFDARMSSFGRNHARPLLHYRGVSFNTSHWNIRHRGEVVYRHELFGRMFTSGSVALSCGYFTGKEDMAVEASADGTTWQPIGVVPGTGPFRFEIPASVFPAKALYVRLRANARTNLQVGGYRLECDFDGVPVMAWGSTKYVDAETGEVFGEVKAPAFADRLSDANARLLADEGGVALWSAVSDVKVFRSTPVPKASGAGVALRLAGDERESVQLVVTAREEALQDVSVAVDGDLSLVPSERSAWSPALLPAAEVKVERVGYVKVEIATDDAGMAGLWPDPLLPQDAARPLTIACRENQPFWITVHAPAGQPAGVYRGALRVRAVRSDGGKYERRVPFAVEVFGFDLPRRMTCESGFGFSVGRVADYHRLRTGSAAHDEVLEKYVRLFSESRIAIYGWGKGQSPVVKWINASDPARATPQFDWSAFDDAHEEMWGRFGFNAFRVHVDGLGRGFQGGFKPGTICGVPSTNALYQALMGRYLGAIEAHLREKGWLGASYVYWFDEPQSQCFRFVNEGMATMKRHAPGIRRLLTNECDDALDNVNLWNPRLDHVFSGQYAKYRARGDQFWWYICCGPKAPYPTEFIDHPGDSLRAWLWMTWAENIRGILIWETSLWTSKSVYPDPLHPQNPYVDAMAWSGRGSTWGNGDGRFVYPPLATVETPRGKGDKPVLDGPNGSYRLAILRDGVEDYEYFAILRRADPHNALLKVPKSVFRDVRDYSTDPTAMREHRLKVAREIVRLGAQRRLPSTCVPARKEGAAKAAAPACRAVDLVLLGDCAVAGWEGAGADELGRLRKGRAVHVLGGEGDRIQNVLGRIERGELDGYSAKAVAVHVGAENSDATPEEMVLGVRRLLSAVRARQPKAKVVLYAILPQAGTWRGLRCRAANKLYAALAADSNAVFRRLPETVAKPDGTDYAAWRGDLEVFLGSL